MIVDTGSSITVVNSALLAVINSSLDNINPVRNSIRTVTGEKVPLVGRGRMKITIGDRDFIHDVWIGDISEDVILGLDFMKAHRCQVDLEHSSMCVNGECIDLICSGSNDAQVFRIVLNSTVVIPARTEVVVQGCVNGLKHLDDCCIIEPNEQKVPGILVGKVLAKMERGCVPVRVLNVADRPRKIKKGSYLARGESTSSDNVVSEDLEEVTNKSQDSSETTLPEHLEDLFERSACQVQNMEERNSVKKLLSEYADVFSRNAADIGRTGMIKHNILTGDHPPIKQPARRMPAAKREEARKAIDEMQRSGVIEQSTSPWSSPIVLVRKKNGSTRFCVDYRKLNSITKKDSYPLPRIDDTLEALEGASWFSTLDLKSGYWQVQLDTSAKEKTAFSLPGMGHWQFKIMPFGLCNAPATFERLMEYVLAGLSWKVCLVYLDDIIVYGSSFLSQMENLGKVLQQLRWANLKLSPEKCVLFQRQVTYLGYIVNEHGVSADPSKLEAVSSWPVPTSVTQVKRFLGLASYYRRFIRNFAGIASPLHRLTEKNATFVWTPDADEAFKELKRTLCNAPVLVLPKGNANYLLDTDASGESIGAVLSQRDEQGEEKVIAYLSKTLNRAERQYCVTRKELLAVVRAVSHFHCYLYGQKFKVRTDHSSLQWLLRFRHPEGQLARWIEILQEYDFAIEFRAGKQHQNADAMSRRPCLNHSCGYCNRVETRDSLFINNGGRQSSDVGAKERERESQLNEGDNLVARICDSGNVIFEQISKQDLRKNQLRDTHIGPILRRLASSSERPEWEDISSRSEETKVYWAQWDSLTLRDNILYRVWESPNGKETRLQLVVPKSLRDVVLKQLHDSVTSGHFGVSKTLNKVRERFYWIGCRGDVRKWCEQCDSCKSRKGPKRKDKAPLKTYLVGAPMERIGVDILGPLPKSEEGNRYLLVCMDYFTKWPEVYPIPNQEAETIAKVLVEEFVCRFGVPLQIHSDQGRNFCSNVFAEMCTLLGIKKTQTTPYHPQSDGMVERYNRTLVAQLSMFVEIHQRDWDKHIPYLLMAYRTAVHESTKVTPAKLMLGREIRVPVDLVFGRPENECVYEGITEYGEKLAESILETHEFARSTLKTSSLRMKRQYDVDAKTKLFHAGDVVWLFSSFRKKGLAKKLMRPWTGPYRIVKRINDLVYKIQLTPNSKPKIVHRNRLWKYSGRMQSEDTVLRRSTRVRKEPDRLTL